MDPSWNLPNPYVTFEKKKKNRIRFKSHVYSKYINFILVENIEIKQVQRILFSEKFRIPIRVVTARDKLDEEKYLNLSFDRVLKLHFYLLKQ